MPDNTAPKIVSDNAGDYVANLAKNESLWLSVGNASLYIKQTDEGLVVDIYAAGHEDAEPLASTYVFEQELLEAQLSSDEDAGGVEVAA